MENINKEEEIDLLQEKLEELYTERKNIENAILRDEERFDVRELSETDPRRKTMAYLHGRYSELDLEIQKIKDKISELRNKSTLQQKEDKLSSLEAEEKTISEAEALIEQQKEGQDIGE